MISTRTFYANSNYKLERRMNTWLALHPKYEVINVSFSSSILTGYEAIITYKHNFWE